MFSYVTRIILSLNQITTIRNESSDSCLRNCHFRIARGRFVFSALTIAVKLLGMQLCFAAVCHRIEAVSIHA